MNNRGFFVYKTAPFQGYKLGEKWKFDIVVAISKKRLDAVKESRKKLMVIDKTKKTLEFMEFSGREKPIFQNEFKDKWNRNEKYLLFYYVWKPTKQLEMNI